MDFVKKLPMAEISIHAARVGCDNLCLTNLSRYNDFNPRSPSGLRPIICIVTIRYSNFNPRSPSGLRLFLLKKGINLLRFQSTQPEWAATRKFALCLTIMQISIHAARVGCDVIIRVLLPLLKRFQSTQPEWAATAFVVVTVFEAIISIHAARVGCDISIATF